MNETMRNKYLCLVIPDGPVRSALLEALREEHGYDLTVLSSGLDALEQASRRTPDLLILSPQSSDISAAELMARLYEITQTRKFPDIPVILFSPEGETVPCDTAWLERGLKGSFSLPFGSHEIRELVKNLFNEQEISDPTKELKAEVRRSEYRYRDLLENANDFIFTLDFEGCFVYLNNRFKPLSGFEKEEWIGKPFLNFIASKDRPEAGIHYQMVHQGRARIFEAEIVDRDNRRPILSFSVTPIVEKGRISGFMGIGRDVTEQKTLEKEIINLTQFNESIIESMEAGLLTTDLEGMATSLNAGGEKILECRKDEILGKSLRRFFPAEEIRLFTAESEENPSLIRRREMDLTLRSGKKKSIGFTVTHRLDNQKRKVGTIVSFRDISELKQMQVEIFRMDRLASLGVLASGIAHEIKNPLAGIKTLAQACEEEFDPDDSRREYLIRIIRQVNRLDELLKTFFSFARPRPPNRSKVALPLILQEVLGLVSQKLSSARIEYHQNVPEVLPEVLVDFQQMQQVFLNLFINSIDAMPGGGKLTLSADNAQNGAFPGLIGEGIAGRQVRITLSDTGEGIPEEKLQTIFDPFYTTKPGGVGLGLSIVYRIIQEHEGEILVKSAPGLGTSFVLTLPTGVHS
ncbi:PAS domain S-box protein [bacterium]|nr:PAS domain S-box protein [bacterium]